MFGWLAGWTACLCIDLLLVLVRLIPYSFIRHVSVLFLHDLFHVIFITLSRNELLGRSRSVYHAFWDRRFARFCVYQSDLYLGCLSTVPIYLIVFKPKTAIYFYGRLSAVLV